jgi:DNA polymerase III alpha subunit
MQSALALYSKWHKELIEQPVCPGDDEGHAAPNTSVGAKGGDDGHTRSFGHWIRNQTCDSSKQSVKYGSRNNLEYQVLNKLGFKDYYPILESGWIWILKR